MMKTTRKRRFLSFLTVLALACAHTVIPTFAIEATATHADLGHAQVLIDGCEVCFLDGEGGRREVISRGGSIYVPLTTVGLWMGADAKWDTAAKTVSLTHNGKDPVYYTSTDFNRMEVQRLEGVEQYQADSKNGVDVVSCPDVTVIVDGNRLEPDASEATPVSPILFRSEIYLPQQMLGPLLGKETLTLWDSNNWGTLNIYDVPAAEMCNEAVDYFTAAWHHVATAKAIIQGTAPHTEAEFTDKIRQIQTSLKALLALPVPALPATAYYAEHMLVNAQTVLALNVDLLLPAVENSGSAELLGLDTPKNIEQVSPSVRELPIDEQWTFFMSFLISAQEETSTYFENLESWSEKGEHLARLIRIGSTPDENFSASNAENAAPTQFTDTQDIQHQEAVAALVKLGIIKGKDDGSFDPGGDVTRAEMVKMLSVTINSGSEAFTGTKLDPSFSDISGHWAEGYIEYCVDLGILSGRGDGTFAPEDKVIGFEAIKMVLAMLGYDPAAYKLTGASWAVRTDELAKKADPGLYTGLDGVAMAQPITRDSAAQVLYNALQNNPKVVKPVTNMETGTVQWHYAASDKTFLEDRFRHLTEDEVKELLPSRKEN